MRSVETNGKTLEEAKEAAAEQLGVSVDKLEIEVLEEVAKGFLRFGQSKIRIKATTDVDAPEVTEPMEEQPIEQAMEEVSASAPELSGQESEAALSRGGKVIELLESIMKAMEFDAHPEIVSEDDEEIYVELTGTSDDIGRLIGRHGQTLDALQYLVAIAVNRGDYNKVRVILDAEGYRERHAAVLTAKALEYAREVKQTGNEAELEPQSARDRRTIHLALADDPDVETYSEGEGDARHVVISPKK